jgi:hypothetical protein
MDFLNMVYIVSNQKQNINELLQWPMANGQLRILESYGQA